MADVCYWFGEGAPLNVNDMTLDMPAGYDFDLCSSEIGAPDAGPRRAAGRCPRASSYRYLLLPDTDRMTLPLARKIRELVDGGARVIGGPRPKGSPGLTDLPAMRRRGGEDRRGVVGRRARRARPAAGRSLPPGRTRSRISRAKGSRYIHRRVGEADIYFVSHQENSRARDRLHVPASPGKPGTLGSGDRRDPRAAGVRARRRADHRPAALRADAKLVRRVPQDRRSEPSSAGGDRQLRSPRALREHRCQARGRSTFDPKWGGPAKPVAFEELTDWSKHSGPGVRYYSGTAVYRTTFDLSADEVSGGKAAFCSTWARSR